MPNAICSFRCRGGGAGCLTASAADWKDGSSVDHLSAATKNPVETIVKGKRTLSLVVFSGCATKAAPLVSTSRPSAANCV